MIRLDVLGFTPNSLLAMPTAVVAAPQEFASRRLAAARQSVERLRDSRRGRFLRTRWSEPLLNAPEIEPDVSTVTTSDGAQLRVHSYGPVDADPIVLIHGWTCCIEFWYPQINELAQQFRVISYDQRGHGESTFGSDTPSSDVLADDLDAVLQATVRSRRPATLVGHSMGGMTIMAWAGRYPEHVQRYAKAAVLANTGTDSLVHDSNVIRSVTAAPVVGPVAGAVVLGAPIPLPPRGMTRGLYRYAIMSPRASDEQVDFCQRISFACSGRARGRWGVALSHLDVRTALANLRVPTVVLAGAEDRLTPPVHAERIAADLNDFGNLDRLVVMPGVGHMASVENSPAFSAVIRELVVGRAQAAAI